MRNGRGAGAGPIATVGQDRGRTGGRHGPLGAIETRGGGFVVVWAGKGVLLDGHNRHAICLRHGLTFHTVAVELADRDAAADWIDANQLGRRNLNPDQYSLLRGRRYNRAKKSERGGGDRRSSSAANQSHQNDGNGPTADRLASQHGVSKATIERDGQFAAAVETLKEVDPQIEEKVVAGTAPAKSLVVGGLGMRPAAAVGPGDETFRGEIGGNRAGKMGEIPGI